jgi:hypothetical protein
MESIQYLRKKRWKSLSLSKIPSGVLIEKRCVWSLVFNKKKSVSAAVVRRENEIKGIKRKCIGTEDAENEKRSGWKRREASAR